MSRRAARPRRLIAETQGVHLNDPTRKGDWTQCFSGGAFFALDPRASEVFIEDIAAHLAKLCRFGGAVQRFYSVGEHSVRVSHVCDPAVALWGLLHDAAEAYLVDVPRPIKRFLVGYAEIEHDVMRVVCERFGLPLEEPPSVALADSVLVLTEARDLAKRPVTAKHPAAMALPGRIRPWTWQRAEREFLARFRELGGAYAAGT